MTTVQVIISISLAAIFPTMTALIGMLLNRSDTRELRDKLDSLRTEMHGSLNAST